MLNTIDVVGLREVASHLRNGAGALELIGTEGATELARIGLWADRSLFTRLMEDRAAWARRMATDLEARATGMSIAEATVQALCRSDRLTTSDRWWMAGRQQRIDKALAAITDLLSTPGTKIWLWSLGDTDVSIEELVEIGTILMDLAPSEMRSVLQRLDDDLLVKWLDATDDHELARDWQPALFDHLAQRAGALLLARMVLVSSGDTRRRLMDSISEAASEWTKQWVFRQVVASIGEDDGLPQIAADLLAAMDPVAREAALDRLHTRGQYESLIAALLMVDRESVTALGHGGASLQFSVRYDAGPLITFINAVGGIGDPDLKAHAFVVAVELLSGPLALASENLDIKGVGNVFTTHRFDGESGKAALAALAMLIVTDPPGVLDALRLDADFLGNTTADFFRELLRAPGQRGTIAGEPISHDGAILTNQLVAALLGDGLDPAQRASFFQARELTSGGSVDFANAARLGYLAGTISGGFDRLGAPDDEQWSAVGIILGGLTFVDRTKITSVIGYLNSSLTQIASEIERQTIRTLQAKYRSFEYALLEEILPRDGNYIFDGDAADEFFNTYDRVGGLVAR